MGEIRTSAPTEMRRAIAVRASVIRTAFPGVDSAIMIDDMSVSIWPLTSDVKRA